MENINTIFHFPDSTFTSSRQIFYCPKSGFYKSECLNPYGGPKEHAKGNGILKDIAR